eukprot:TRINITY_DN85868_c0_g1_i1.p1 TRINITY_DN85868_c0_g1~~TRINITY_DN85868_c0_g1_i1.p1  ORF type:complete len:220 (+),score=35.92 TRINITY_DN85868_c0_g1_i1:51-662(+)
MRTSPQGLAGVVCILATVASALAPARTHSSPEHPAAAFLAAHEAPAPLSYEQWEGHCMTYVNKLVHNIDRSYTDVQMVPNLQQQCILEHFFPKSREDGFDEQKACHDFAVRLAEARERELAGGEDRKDGYRAFCADFYQHKGYGKAEAEEEQTLEVTLEKPTAEPKKEGRPWMKIGLGCLVLLIIVVGCYYAMSKRGQERTHL